MYIHVSCRSFTRPQDTSCSGLDLKAIIHKSGPLDGGPSASGISSTESPQIFSCNRAVRGIAEYDLAYMPHSEKPEDSERATSVLVPQEAFL